MGPLLSTVQDLPDGVREEVERALVPVARRAAVGALAADIAHDAGNALFGLIGLLDLMVDDEVVGAQRRELLLNAAGGLDRALTPLLRFTRDGDDEGARGDLATAARGALDLYRHGEHRLLEIDVNVPAQAPRVECPPSAALQIAVHLLLAADPVERVEVDATSLRVEPVREPSLDEVAAARLAADRGGSVVREHGALVLRLPGA